MDKAALDELPDISPIADLDNVPSFDELTAAFASTRENKAPGSCGIPAEVWKHGGKRLQEKLHELIVDIWKKEQMPQNWKDAIIVPIFKKGRRKECGNYRGISLLSTAGKILARIILNRIEEKMCTLILPETQCGFRRNRSTIDIDRPRLRFKDVAKRNMKMRKIPVNSWLTTVSNRDTWRSAIKP